MDTLLSKENLLEMICYHDTSWFGNVFLWGQEIGRLAWHDARKTTFFFYNPEFLKGTLDIAPLAASIHNPLSTRAIFGEAERIYQKLPSFIADSLPDAWGNSTSLQLLMVKSASTSLVRTKKSSL